MAVAGEYDGLVAFLRNARFALVSRYRLINPSTHFAISRTVSAALDQAGRASSAMDFRVGHIRKKGFGRRELVGDVPNRPPAPE